jgi:hypothetical protein
VPTSLQHTIVINNSNQFGFFSGKEDLFGEGREQKNTRNMYRHLVYLNSWDFAVILRQLLKTVVQTFRPFDISRITMFLTKKLKIFVKQVSVPGSVADP